MVSAGGGKCVRKRSTCSLGLVAETYIVQGGEFLANESPRNLYPTEMMSVRVPSRHTDWNLTVFS
jgi:hypothetical protein